jgi:hypothetical protein
MSALDAFMTVWSRARTAFGEGSPVEGAEFDKSAQLQNLHDTVLTAAPGDHWTGGASDNYADRNSQHASKLGRMADLDRRLSAEVDRSAAVVAAGRRDLDAVKQWVSDASTGLPQNAAGNRALWEIVSKGSGDVADIIQRSHNDMTAISGRIQGIGNEWDELGDKDKPGGPQPITDPHKADAPPEPPQAGQPVGPTTPWWVGDNRFGHWEDVPPAPPYVGASPPPLKDRYDPFPPGNPGVVGPSTGMYTPGQSWIGDIDPPAVVGQEGYKFRIAGFDHTTTTRMVNINGQWQQQRWVQNVYEYQRNTSYAAGGDLAGLPPIQNIDQTWKPISIPQVAQLSANNPSVTYYLPNDCGGTTNFQNGAAPVSGTPPTPVMTKPR